MNLETELSILSQCLQMLQMQNEEMNMLKCWLVLSWSLEKCDHMMLVEMRLGSTSCLSFLSSPNQGRTVKRNQRQLLSFLIHKQEWLYSGQSWRPQRLATEEDSESRP